MKQGEEEAGTFSHPQTRASGSPPQDNAKIAQPESGRTGLGGPRNMNKVIARGNLASDVTLRETQTGKKVASFKLAVNRRGEDAGADFFWVKTWNGSADACAKYLTKGSEVLIEGSINSRSVKQDDGSYVNYFEVNAPSVQFLRRARTHGDEETPEIAETTTDAPTDDEIPF